MQNCFFFSLEKGEIRRANSVLDSGVHGLSWRRFSRSHRSLQVRILWHRRCWPQSMNRSIYFISQSQDGILKIVFAFVCFRFCAKKWSGASLVLGTMYAYDIFAAMPCCPDRLTVSTTSIYSLRLYYWIWQIMREENMKFEEGTWWNERKYLQILTHAFFASPFSFLLFLQCNSCFKLLLYPHQRLNFFSDYSHVVSCMHCTVQDTHFVKPLSYCYTKQPLQNFHQWP